MSIFHITENMSLIKQSVTSEFDFYFEGFFILFKREYSESSRAS